MVLRGVDCRVSLVSVNLMMRDRNACSFIGSVITGKFVVVDDDGRAKVPLDIHDEQRAPVQIQPELVAPRNSRNDAIAPKRRLILGAEADAVGNVACLRRRMCHPAQLKELLGKADYGVKNCSSDIAASYQSQHDFLTYLAMVESLRL
jgi:hypothetical protein